MLLLHTISPIFLLTGLISSTATKPLQNSTIVAGSWTAVAPITIEPRQEHSSVKFDNDTIYILGGTYPLTNGGYPTVTTAQRYTISSDTWVIVADLPMPLNHANSAVVNGKIYVLGGLTTTNDTFLWNATRASFEYDPKVNRWTRICDLPAGREIGSAAVAVRGSTIYLAGGQTNLSLIIGAEGTSSLFTSYNVITKQFSFLPDMPEPRDHAGVGLVAEKLYVLGGRAYQQNNTKDTVFSYDFDKGSWSTGLASMPTGRAGCSSGVIGQQIFTFGGEGDQVTTTGVFPQTQAYDTVTDSWTDYLNMDVPRHGTAGVAIGNRVYIAGGGVMSGPRPTNFTSYFQLSAVETLGKRSSDSF
ncbi:Kelch-like protein [Lachnellula hyalina]|uniref:Kelch-like protein n=1 Tax=Lachnellula hyalina TaxID=1316788 RepID=A0A8H8TUC7_9HELO|nr:Kelch-like protein [Lachnellula hyalina]TVY22644.1 Kelch-like protein [Lachnellula hyalina]